MPGIDVKTPQIPMSELVEVLDRRYKRYPVPDSPRAGSSTVYADSSPGGAPVDSSASQIQLNVPNNGSASYTFGQKKNFGTVHMDYGAYRGTAKWAGQATIQHYAASDGDSSDTDDTVRAYGQVLDGDVMDSNMLPHLVWVASIASGSLVLTVTASDDATLGDTVLIISFRTTQEHV